MRFGKAVLIAIDQLANALAGGWPDETLSSRAWRLKLSGRPRIADAIDWLAACFGDENHCRDSYISERVGRQLPPELRGN